jgi:vacuolar-type H+-ATPase subunit E/Vma4
VEVETDDGVGGGLILATRDGRRLFDNTYATRLDRLRGELRSAVCAGFAADEDDNQDG